ncbi:NAD(P)/FAD-dependent oxidoreductase [Winogradskyella immobilis]|uniref:NADH:ubiquinone reductase (non-electrogenic) n=1 Tax=Winogradskyella immobilis TaxID=2816852 RepID=A0ABS8ERD0_9FLAO|nr:NAD(P)/FAD-dependent oxidoreductase [Winogradskyella immobilis]MCC1485422.1 NAD(P)/FAD-dependent oxidoreductase [Winogradskyella immobilis]MCG0017514.1 NAD(P)/FAD-dependent oxidoreductase [Winogradskyella immobilis]
MNIPNIDLPRIVVVGSGFAGLKFVRKVNSQNAQIVLLDKNNYHTFQPLLYQVASSGLEPDSIVYPIRKTFKGKKNFHFRMAKVNSINTTSNQVETNIGILKYDYLVVATGAITNFFGMKNIKRYSYTMKSLRESLDLRSIILQNFEKAVNTYESDDRKSYMNFVIVGGGATGVELAGALAELKRNIFPKDYPDLDISKMQVNLIEASDRVLSNMSQNSSNKSKEALENLGVNVFLNTIVKDYDGNIIKTNEKDIHAKTLIWSAGVLAEPINSIDFKLNKSNRIITDEFNKVFGFDNIFAIGDVCCIKKDTIEKEHPMLASVAGQQGHHLGKNLNAIIKKKKTYPFVYKDRGTMATIGKNKAVVDLPFIKFSGIFAWLVWMFLHLMLLVDFRNRLIVFVNWIWSYFKYDKGLRLIIREAKAYEKYN